MEVNYMSHQDLKSQAKLDEIDLQLIAILNEDGRTPFAQIAQRLDVSTGMIRQRYQRLVREGILQIVAITNPLLMGYTTMAHIGVKVDANRLEEIADEIAVFEEVSYLVLLTGRYDLIIEVVCRDNTHLLNFLCYCFSLVACRQTISKPDWAKRNAIAFSMPRLESVTKTV